MRLVVKYILILAGCWTFTSCKHHAKPSGAVNKPVEVADFIASFKPAKIPYQVTDSIFKKRDNDSALIDYDIFTQFVPDTLLEKFLGKDASIKVYPLVKLDIARGGIFLLIKTIAGEKKAVFLLGFNKQSKFIAGIPLLQWPLVASQQTAVIDKRNGITRNVTRKNPDGSISEGKDVYVMNDKSPFFTLIMTDPLDEKPAELINPIDTLPRKNKLSADYVAGKNNLVSIRDGRKNDRITFFIHFEKNNDCSGDIKGEAMLRSSTTAEYQETGDPCRIHFNFTTHTVSIGEENCGSHRGLLCSFDGTFPRKKEIKPKIVRKRK